ncbi:uroporphyrinogen-III C-methyltransferase, partial [Klebsiella pneumoniae]|nr:uroporphyrinogen-III C-methyltransferase [Klebsiella pneumoniae]
MLDGVLKPGVQVKNEAASASWWQNVWEKSLGTLKGLVEIRRLENNDAMLISPEQAYFVRENLRLRLLDARTALMQRNSEVYQGDLNNAEAAVRQYFDAKFPATQSWLKELAELKALDVRMTADDGLKNSLNAVRAYRDGTRMTAADNQEAEQAASEPANENTAS